MNTKEAAIYARVSVDTIRDAAEAGVLSGVKVAPDKPKSSWRFTDSDIDTWLEQGRVGAFVTRREQRRLRVATSP